MVINFRYYAHGYWRMVPRIVFVITQIKCGFKILKPWYGCVIVDSCTCTLSDPYDELVEDSSSNGGLPLADEYLGASVEIFCYYCGAADNSLREDGTHYPVCEACLRKRLLSQKDPSKIKLRLTFLFVLKFKIHAFCTVFLSECS